MNEIQCFHKLCWHIQTSSLFRACFFVYDARVTLSAVYALVSNTVDVDFYFSFQFGSSQTSVSSRQRNTSAQWRNLRASESSQV